jgi:RHS repeat-associated protein
MQQLNEKLSTMLIEMKELGYIKSPQGELYTNPFFCFSCLVIPNQKKALYRNFSHSYYRIGARYYDPDIGRWISPDPKREFHDLYNYVGGNPVNAIDPNGENKLEVSWIYASGSAGVGSGQGATGFIVDFHQLSQGNFNNTFYWKNAGSLGAGLGVGGSSRLKFGWDPNKTMINEGAFFDFKVSGVGSLFGVSAGASGSLLNPGQGSFSIGIGAEWRLAYMAEAGTISNLNPEVKPGLNLDNQGGAAPADNINVFVPLPDK